MNPFNKVVFLGTALFLSQFAMAQDEATQEAQPQYGSLSPAVWTHIYEMVGAYMPEDVISDLVLIGYHVAAEEICNGVHTDSKKLGQAMLNLRPKNFDTLSTDEQTHWNNAFLGNYGMVVGVMVADHADNADSFCNEVHGLIADPANDWHYFDANWTEAEEKKEADS